MTRIARRPRLSLCLATLLAAFPLQALLHAQVVINEIHYAEDNAAIHSEFIELYNACAASVDLSGWFFEKGIIYTFPAGTTLAAGSYLVVCEDPATLQSKWGSRAWEC